MPYDFFAPYLCNRSQKCTVNGALSSASKLTCSVPQGSILGPLFFLMYINDLPNCFDISCAKVFADDTKITVTGCNFAELEQATNSEPTILYSWLKADKLSLNIAKTEFMVVSSRQKFLAENCSELNTQLDNQPISRVEYAKSLGLIVDDRLSRSNYIKELCRKISSAIGALRRIRSLIFQSTAVQIYKALTQPHLDYCAPVWGGLGSYLCDDRLSRSNYIKELCRKISSAIGALRRIRSLIFQSTAVQIYKALTQPHLDYCAPVWGGLGSYLCEKLQKLQNREARVILQANCEVNSSLLLETLKWDQLSLRRKKHKAKMIFKSLNGLAPVYLHELFSK